MSSKPLSIDLQCSLCPKNPYFSDISHLLTHISSKSHLAHRFKLQIRSSGEAEAKAKLDDFDYWYHNNNLATLLSDRLTAKEHKKTAKERKSRSNAQGKKEKEPRKNILAETPEFRAPVPRMHLWPTTTNNEEALGISPNEWEPTTYETPTTRRHVPNFTRNETPTDDQLDPKLMTPWKPEPGETDGKKDAKLTDSARLKGVLWPGMNLFDSATPEMKRMRNQRKDSIVLEQMMATSAGVEPAEISYHPNGDFRGSRDIFGPPSIENSPVYNTSPRPLLRNFDHFGATTDSYKVQYPTPKKRKPRKVALMDVSVNAPRLRASRAKKAVRAQSPQKRQSTLIQGRSHGGNKLLKPVPSLNPLAGCSRRFAPSSEEDDEFRLTIEEFGKKRSFSIFQDAPEISPGRTESPLEDHRFEFTNHGLPQFLNNSTPSTLIQASPTPVPRHNSFRVFGKENGQPEMPAQFQCRPASTPPRMMPSQMFYQQFNPLFSHSFAGGPFSFGDHQSNFQENRTSSVFSSNFHGDFRQVGSMARPEQLQGQASGNNSNNSAGCIQFGI